MSFAHSCIKHSMLERYFYDLHVHSCLSPCGDDDMTPCNIAGMAALKGLQIVALTDHNTTKNCPAFFAAAKQNGIIPVAGAEITTSEDVHAVCLFPTLEEAMEFDAALDEWRIPFQNDPDAFGHQEIMDEEDRVIGEVDDLLINAVGLSLDELYPFVSRFGGVCFPAHVDKEANSVTGMLGTVPDHPAMHAVEFHDESKIPSFREKHPAICGKLPIISSDAHYLWDISEAEHFLMLESEEYSADNIRRRLFQLLKGEDTP